jgi:eukaryotic-like serine/threonine-protein kinase
VVFLRLGGRGRPGERCAPSWVRIKAFPGFRTGAAQPVVVGVPTCQASRADTVEIERGPFVYGGPGTPPSPFYGREPEYTEPERAVDLEAFTIDRTEVANAAFLPFRQLARITGYPAPIYDTEPSRLHDSDPSSPVTSIDAFEAAAYCAYLGKHLPSDFQWTKAARGGSRIRGALNPWPPRLYPWGVTARPDCVNEARDPQHLAVAPVDAYPCGQSPYGVFNLVGNVQEWIDRDGQTDRENPMYALRGGAADSPPSHGQTTTVFRNHRRPTWATYAIGFRCAGDVVSP